MNNVGMSLKNMVSEIAPITNKMNAKNRNFPLKRTSGFSDFIDVRENKSPIIIEIIRTEKMYI